MRLSNIEKLINIVEQSKISELEITDFWGRRIRISKTIIRKEERATEPAIEVPGVKESHIAPEKPAGKKVETKDTKGNLVPIRSPIVGTFYRSPAPDAPRYVEIGDIVKLGQVVCIVEAMKLMNEIESDVAGKVVEILVKNEDPVEYNQELFLIESLQ